MTPARTYLSGRMRPLFAALVFVLPLLQSCSEDHSTDADQPDSEYALADEERPQPIGQVEIIYDGNPLSLDVYGCHVSSHYLRDPQAAEGQVFVQIDAVSPGTNVLTAVPSATYQLNLKIHQQQENFTATLLDGSNNDESWRYLGLTLSPAEAQLLEATTGFIRIDDAALDLRTGATERLVPRPGLANAANPGTGQFEIEINTVARPDLEAQLAPFKVLVSARCEITWLTV